MKKLKNGLFSVVASLLLLAGILPATVNAQSGMRYVAMGDSVAAGIGLTSLSSPTAKDLACGRSAQAYSKYVAAGWGTSVKNVACSGASADNLYNTQTRSGVTLAPQIDAAFASGKPDVITITVGANDIGWQNFIKKCYAYSCGSSTDNATAKTLRGVLRAQLFKALWYVNQKSNGNPPKVLLTGYYAPFSSKQCSDTAGLTAAEKTWVNSQTAQLNQAIYSVTQWFGTAQYVPVSFAGHTLCSSSPWIQGLKAAAPFHPTATGQKAIANAILKAY
jgi:lysophospholipase L1-like esterase